MDSTVTNLKDDLIQSLLITVLVVLAIAALAELDAAIRDAEV